VEHLEDRQLPSITVSILNGVLTVDCVGKNTVTVDHVGSTTLINQLGFSDQRFTSILINGGDGGTTENLQATVKPIDVVNQLLRDTVNVGDAVATVQGIQAPLTLENPPSYNAVAVDDFGDADYRTVTLDTFDANGDTYGRITGLAPAAINIKGIDTDTVTIFTGGGGATVRVVSTYPRVPITLFGNETASNTLVGSDAANTFTLLGTDVGTLASSSVANQFLFLAYQNLTGGPGNNTFAFRNGGFVSGDLVGGGGTNTLDYSGYSAGNVFVDYQTATFTGVGGTVTGIPNAIGASGGGADGLYNVFVGSGGNVFTGGNGRRNLLIAGASPSTLLGGADEDILIGGTTTYDTDPAALAAIMTEWARTDEGYATRVASLLSGTNAPVLDGTTVTGNGGGNTLLGGPGLDLFYGSLTDTTDRTVDETFIVV
jgi:hypothetical protein